MANALPEDALHKILGKIQAQVVSSQRELAMVRAQIASRERETKLSTLTLSQLFPDGQQPQGGYYRSVGKMFIQDTPTNISSDLETKSQTLREEIKALEKKQKYLEKQAADAQAHLKDIFSSVNRQQAQSA
ncbi:hypothetical protein ACQY0O_001858 [Thecaphora frezii]